VLLDQHDVLPILACPCCRTSLQGADVDALRCDGCSTIYSAVDRWPVLVDFDSSILNPSTLAPTREPQSPATWGTSRPHPDVQRNLDKFRKLIEPGQTVLVVGGGVNAHGVTLYDDPDVNVIGFDIYPSQLTQFVADGHQIPLVTGSVDAVLIQAVLEHVLDPWRVVAEIRRVLRTGGIVYAETPFLQQVHEGAYDFTRFTDSGHRWLFREFDLIDSGAIGGPGLQAVWTIDYLTRGLLRSPRAGGCSRRLTRWLQHLDNRIPPDYRIDAAACVYFLGRKSETAITARDMADYYQGAQ
jgi:SAM-dependent methyltransferase